MVKPFTKLIYLFLLLKMPTNQHYGRNYNNYHNRHQDISPSAQRTQSMDFSIFKDNKENNQKLKTRNNNNNNSEFVKNLPVRDEMKKWIKQDQLLDETESSSGRKKERINSKAGITKKSNSKRKRKNNWRIELIVFRYFLILRFY